jgi:RNA polymerase sigma-70 factor (ECF subfamily)
VIEPAALGAWQDLEAKLRPFVSRRVRAEADADDVLQDVFLRMQRGLPQLRDDQRLGPWVYQVTRSALAEHHRTAARHPVVSLPEDDVEITAGAPEGDDGDEVERRVASSLALFVSMLPSPYREALTLTELEGRTQREAAEILGVSLSGMKSRVQRGRERLRAALEGVCKIGLDARGRVVDCQVRPDARLPDNCCG